MHLYRDDSNRDQGQNAGDLHPGRGMGEVGYSYVRHAEVAIRLILDRVSSQVILHGDIT